MTCWRVEAGGGLRARVAYDHKMAVRAVRARDVALSRRGAALGGAGKGELLGGGEGAGRRAMGERSSAMYGQGARAAAQAGSPSMTYGRAGEDQQFKCRVLGWVSSANR